RVACSDFATAPLRSTRITLAAPREAASKPRTPVPAKSSRQSQPVRSWPSQLKSDSRTRSGVGRRPSSAGTGSFERFHRPPMIRTRESIASLECGKPPGRSMFGFFRRKKPPVVPPPVSEADAPSDDSAAALPDGTIAEPAPTPAAETVEPPVVAPAPVADVPTAPEAAAEAAAAPAEVQAPPADATPAPEVEAAAEATVPALEAAQESATPSAAAA